MMGFEELLSVDTYSGSYVRHDWKNMTITYSHVVYRMI